jgi:heme exporter protein D
MMAQGAHWGFVLTAFGVVAVVVAALIAWVVLDGRRHRRTLAALEAQGVRRRSTRDGA